MRKLDSLTGIRAIAAFWVVLYHRQTAEHLSFGLLDPLIAKGYLGVDLFFLLSGFVISYAHQKDFFSLHWQRVCQFLALRWARIMPVHLFVLGLFGLHYLAMIAMRGYLPTDDIGWSPLYFVYALLNIHAWGITDHLSWNHPSWSVSAEWFAYLLFPMLALFLLKTTSIRKNILGIIGLFSGLFAFSQLAGKHDINWSVDYALVRVACEFTAGICLFNLFRSQAVKNSVWNWMGGLSLAAIIAAVFSHFSDFAIIPLFALLLLSLAKSNQGVNQAFSHPAMVALGEISYSLYMVDAFVAMVFQEVLERLHLPMLSAWQVPALVSVNILLSLLAAKLLFMFVEQPARDFLRDRIKPRTKPAAIAPEVVAKETVKSKTAGKEPVESKSALLASEIGT